ncbi:MAG TPA: restriction endonuclease subunit S [Bacteroidales bacterium]|nr:restriction endonuclease subunit S [Bacteroidales bacterium]
MRSNKEGWELVKLCDVCEKVSKINAKTQTGKFNYIDIGSIDSELKRITEPQTLDWKDASSRARQVVRKGDTLFSTVRVNLEKIAFLDKDIQNGIASTGFAVLRPNFKVNPRYLFYMASSPKFIERVSLMQNGTAYPAVNEKLVFNETIFLPSLFEQDVIASLFQSIEYSIEQVESQEKNVLEFKNKLLSDLFNPCESFGNFLRAQDFETVRFEKVGNNISERVEPQKTELTMYVGLEHLDSDNLRIERTGKPDDVIGTKLKIYKGDIIFGKRRAYLRKVAVSHFDGIASAHSMILRANEKNIEKEFLPYFMQSDAFMNRAVQISEGSLSPTIKSKTLAQQEFALPRKEKQPKLIALFKQFDLTIGQLKQQKNNLKNLKHNLLNEILG